MMGTCQEKFLVFSFLCAYVRFKKRKYCLRLHMVMESQAVGELMYKSPSPSEAHTVCIMCASFLRSISMQSLTVNQLGLLHCRLSI